MGFETDPDNLSPFVNNAVIGAIKGHGYIEECLKELEINYDGIEMAHLSSPYLSTIVLQKNGLVKYGEQDICNVHIFNTKTFYPYPWNDIFSYSCLADNTYTIHYWDMSWKDKDAELKEMLYQTKSLNGHITNLENQLSKFQNGKIGMKDWIKLNLKFIKSFFEFK